VTRVLGDADVLAHGLADEVVRLMRDALAAAHRWELHGPARTWLELGAARFAVTAGAVHGGDAGFRVYGGWGPGSDQLTALWNAAGRLDAVVLGSALASMRTGALGGAAVELLARPDSRRLAVIGTGTVAWWQLWASIGRRPFDEVRVFSRDAARRDAFAARVSGELGVAATAAASAEDAVRDADVVIVSTTSRTPVIDAAWLAPGAHVSSTGPKFLGGSEVPEDLVARADLVVSDSPQQAHGDREPWFSQRPLTHLGAVVAGELAARHGDADLTVYCSTGLAGTEVLLARHILERVERVATA